MKIERDDRGAVRFEGFPFWPFSDYVVVVDYGQPNQTEGGLYLGDGEELFGIYRFSMWRYGEVVAVGPGKLGKRGNRLRPPDVSPGEKLMFSRKHGTRIHDGVKFYHPAHKRELLLRVLDRDKCVMVMGDDFKPWWDINETQLNPNGIMTG